MIHAMTADERRSYASAIDFADGSAPLLDDGGWWVALADADGVTIYFQSGEVYQAYRAGEDGWGSEEARKALRSIPSDPTTDWLEANGYEQV